MSPSAPISQDKTYQPAQSFNNREIRNNEGEVQGSQGRHGYRSLQDLSHANAVPQLAPPPVMEAAASLPLRTMPPSKSAAPSQPVAPSQHSAAIHVPNPAARAKSKSKLTDEEFQSMMTNQRHSTPTPK